MKYTLLILVIAFLSCKQSKPLYVEYFKTGDTLGNRIVVDAAALNKVAGLWEQSLWDASERQMDSVLNVYCKSLK